MLKICISLRKYCQQSCSPTTMKFLNVAEKNDAAKNIAAHLSRGSAQRVNEIHTSHIHPTIINPFLYSPCRMKAYQNLIKSINSNATCWDTKMPIC